MLLHGTTSTVVLACVWGGALIGIAMRMLWLSAPRWAVIPDSVYAIGPTSNSFDTLSGVQTMSSFLSAGEKL